jgi:RNA polymerase sigma-70 factor, ECF subfamily
VTDPLSSGHIEVMATADVILLPHPATPPPAPVVRCESGVRSESGVTSKSAGRSESSASDLGSVRPPAESDPSASDQEERAEDESIDIELDASVGVARAGVSRVSIPPPLPERALSRPPPARAPGSPETGARRAAFRTMYEQHVDFVWRNLRRLGVSEAEVDDKAQEVFVIAHRRFDDFEERGHGPRAWLFQIVLRVASDARRHRRRHPVDPDGGAAQDRESVEPEQIAAFDRREALGRLDRALRTIEVGRRAVLVLHEIEEMTAPEISETLGVPLNTVYSRLRVARAELEAALAKEERFGVGDAR